MSNGNSSPLALLPGLYCHIYWAGAGEWCPCTQSSGPYQASPENQEGFQKLCFMKGVGGTQALDLQIPTSQAKQNQTGSASLWSFPFCQTFQRMGDLLEKLNADFRE